MMGKGQRKCHEQRLKIDENYKKKADQFFSGPTFNIDESERPRLVANILRETIMSQSVVRQNVTYKDKIDFPHCQSRHYQA